MSREMDGDEPVVVASCSSSTLNTLSRPSSTESSAATTAKSQPETPASSANPLSASLPPKTTEQEQPQRINNTRRVSFKGKEKNDDKTVEVVVYEGPLGDDHTHPLHLSAPPPALVRPSIPVGLDPLSLRAPALAEVRLANPRSGDGAQDLALPPPSEGPQTLDWPPQGILLDAGPTTPDSGTTESVMTNNAHIGGLSVHGTTTIDQASTSFNSLGSSQRPILAARHGSDLSVNPSALESGGAGLSSGASSRPSWKKGGGRKQNMERSRLAALGFEEELSRDFDFWAQFGVAICNIGFLPGTFLGSLSAMEYGGGAMYAFAWPVSGLFMCALAAVLGEMASTYPVAGAMFTWVFRLCRSSKRFDGWARYASWVTGSFLLCSHILTQIVLAYQLSTFFQGFLGMFTSDIHVVFWRSMGIAWGILVVCGLLVSSKWSRSPWLWRCCGAGIIVGFLVMNIVLLAKAPSIRSGRKVFLTFTNGTGWSSSSYVFMIGWVLNCFCTGVEACSHIAEDTKNPSRTVPLAMFWSVAISYALGWVSICVILATEQSHGADPNLAHSIGVLANTLPRPYATLVIVIVLLAMASQNIAQLLATSRFIWALARESALPFSHFLRTISSSQRQPIPAIWLVVVIVSLSLLLLRISTQIIATILLEGAAFSVALSYVVPIIIYLFCPDDALAGDGRAQWTLRSFSKPVAYPVTFFVLVFLIVLCLPTGHPVTSLTASYASAVFIGVLFLSTLAWVFYGNSHYAGPIKTTTRWTIGAEVELPASTTFKTTTLPDETTSAAHGRSAHVFSGSVPTLMTNGPPPSSSHGEYTTTTGEWSSGFEDSQFSPESTTASADVARHRSRWAGSPEDGARGRERSVNGRFDSSLGSAGGGSPTATTP